MIYGVAMVDNKGDCIAYWRITGVAYLDTDSGSPCCPRKLTLLAAIGLSNDAPTLSNTERIQLLAYVLTGLLVYGSISRHYVLANPTM